MIDNYQTTMALMEELEAALPIMVTPNDQLIDFFKQHNKKIKANDSLKIIKFIYMSDAGGICCEIEIPSEKTSATIVSLTHLKLKNSHPLYKQVKDYQLTRIKRMAEQNLTRFKA